MPIVRGLPNAAYHADKDHVSHSRIRDFDLRGPRYVQETWILGTREREETKALLFGTAFEVLFCEGQDAFDEQFVIAPATITDWRTKQAQQFKAAHPHEPIVLWEDYETMLEMCQALRECIPGMARVRGCEKQVTLRGHCFGLRMQSRPDYLNLQGDFVTSYRPFTVDLKTTKDLTDLKSRDGMISLGYHTQGAVARACLRECLREMGRDEPIETEHYVFAVEKGNTFRSQLFHLPHELLDWGDRFIDMHARALATCMRDNYWPRAADEIGEVQLPRWANKKPENQPYFDDPMPDAP